MSRRSGQFSRNVRACLSNAVALIEPTSAVVALCDVVVFQADKLATLLVTSPENSEGHWSGYLLLQGFIDELRAEMAKCPVSEKAKALGLG
ncbi:hypothetical protein [Gellertiella hungarica]|uniref:Formate dehydrogenase assembly factor FdhD n=1 Tax=Gellertiella hungarica TaxID=1572859 RepID=A0A7W6J2P1_9HYPH|nr:hypothetical protein [Gellertiella hungarica]MBB4063674.1 formate dehydrogenase assembly factor FdhD [Gellertiella hungarica]